MDALVLAAGLGRRLCPLTDTTPKCLVPVDGRPLIEVVLDRLGIFGLEDVAVTTFHFKDQVSAYFARRPGSPIRVVPESELLGTGGGVRNALKATGPVRNLVVHNCDIASDIDLRDVVGAHERLGADATLVTRRRLFDRSLVFDRCGALIGRAQALPIEARSLADFGEFCGIHVLGPRMARFILDSSFCGCLIDLFIAAARQDLRVLRYDAGDAFWMDLGTLEALTAYQQHAITTPAKLLHMPLAL